MKTFFATLVLATALSGCASFFGGGTHDPIVARDTGFQPHPGMEFAHTAPGHHPMQAGPSD
jgi:hypothetical protein